jgi:glycine oxidase
MNKGPKVIVAGAGALGLSTALALADAGCAVTVCDPAQGPQASAVAAGMLAPVFEAVLDAETAGDLDLLLAARNLWPALAARAGIVIDRSGTAAVGSGTWLAEIDARLARLGVRGAGMPRGMLDAMAPGIAPGLESVLVREDWRLQPRPALAALRAAADAAGVAFRAEAVTRRGDADWLVVATGAGQSLAAAAPELSRLTPIKGQILAFGDIRGGPLSLRGEACYAVPGSAGLAVGATMEVGRDDTAIDLAACAPLAEAATGLFPDLASADFTVSAGVRAATTDGLPMVGASQAPGVILAVGARRNGWLLAPMIADIVLGAIERRPRSAAAQLFDAGRF